VLIELQEVVERPEETDDVLRLGLHRLRISEFLHLRALAPTRAAYDGLTELCLVGWQLNSPFPMAGRRRRAHPDRPNDVTKNGHDHDAAAAAAQSRRRACRGASRA
jgi:hypothetical protein